MKYLCLLMLALAAPAAAAPVHVLLKASAAAPADTSGGFVTLSQIADLSGGSQSARLRMAAVPVGRVPLPGDTRLLTPGDVALKLRQAGFHPEQDAVLEGAKQVSVTAAQVPGPSPSTQAASSQTPPAPTSPNAPAAAPMMPAMVVHSSDSVTIIVQQGDLSITAKGTARQSGAVGQTIRVHRDGAASDLAATVVDAQTVQLEL